MKRPVAMALFVIGVVLLVVGMQSSRSATSQFSELFNNRPSKDTILLIVSGLGCLVVGAASWRR